MKILIILLVLITINLNGCFHDARDDGREANRRAWENKDANPP